MLGTSLRKSKVKRQKAKRRHEARRKERFSVILLVLPLSPTFIKRGLADRVAQMSDLYLWHLHLAECLSVSIPDYLQEKLTFDRLAECTLLLARAIADGFVRRCIGQAYRAFQFS